MPAPPPPPPPPPSLPSSAAITQAPPSSKSRNALLSDIQKGKRLKKAVTNDRSAPIIDAKPSVGASSGNSRSHSSSTGNNGVTHAPVPVGLGGLFAGGVPKLKSRGGFDSDNKDNGLAVPPPLPGGRPRAPSTGNRASAAVPSPPNLPTRNTLPKSLGKVAAANLNSTTTPNRNTPAPPLPTRTPKASPPPPPTPARTTVAATTTTPSLPPLPFRNSKGPPPPPPPPASNKKPPPPLPPNKSAITSTKSESPFPIPLPQRARSPPITDKQKSFSSTTNGATARRALSPPKFSTKSMTHEPPKVEGRWSFHPSTQFPPPGNFTSFKKIYPSGASTGSSVPLDLSALALQGTPQRAPPPPPPIGGGRLGKR